MQGSTTERREVHATVEDFIGVYDNVFSEEFCRSQIERFETMAANGLCVSRQDWDKVHQSMKKDLSYFEGSVMGSSALNVQRVVEALWALLNESYVKEYYFPGTVPLYINDVKMQKTGPGEGYHVWHQEGGTVDSARRMVAWIIYLNDIDAGGETEFLYQSRRVSPKAGRVLMFPTSYTHMHRGNPPLSGHKYILTGWFEL